jgi:hypothetical protein
LYEPKSVLNEYPENFSIVRKKRNILSFDNTREFPNIGGRYIGAENGKF